jgi:hypothetical protein
MCGARAATPTVDFKLLNRNCVLVHAYFGEQLPMYVKKNLLLLRKTFPERRIVFITNNKQQCQEIAKRGIEISEFNVYERESRYISNHMKRDSSFRNDFWFLSLIRLIAVCDWQIRNDTPLLHIESDVILFPNFPFSKLEALQVEIAFPKSRPDLGVASILYLNGSSTAKKLINFCAECILESPDLNDMTLLAKLLQRKDIFNFGILPTAPKKISKEIGAVGVPDSQLLEISSLSEYFEGCFDAAAFGHFFLGDDPRNNRGRKRLFQNLYNFDLNLTNSRLSVKNSNLVASLDGFNFSLFCLHVHSKDLKAFNMKSLWVLLCLRNLQIKRGPKSLVTYQIIKFWLGPYKHKLKKALERFA